MKELISKKSVVLSDSLGGEQENKQIETKKQK
jgi:hypothetical protein